jgi:N-acetylneuraminic acid mutarotase
LGERGVLLVGGSTTIPRLGGKSLSDQWLYSGGKWVSAGGGVPPVVADARAYDASSGRVVVLAVTFAAFEIASVAATWTYDPAADRWEERPSAGRPALLHGARAVYDRKADRLIVVDGGGKTWAYDVDANQWVDRLPQSGPAFAARAVGGPYYAIAYDEQSERTILFGGEGKADTWAYDSGANTWTEMRPAKSPPGRLYHAMTYEPKSDRVILFGGVSGGDEKPYADTWTYDYNTNTWTELTLQSAPSARGWHAMAYDPPSGTVVLFGGGADREHFQADTWVFDPARLIWSSVR